MARLTYAQKLAFAQTVAQFIRDNATGLKDGGFDPAKKLAELENGLKSAVELDVQQEALKAKLVEATDKAVNGLRPQSGQLVKLWFTVREKYGKNNTKKTYTGIQDIHNSGA